MELSVNTHNFGRFCKILKNDYWFLHVFLPAMKYFGSHWTDFH